MVHHGWYDRTIRRARDLSNGDTRIYLEFEVRRVACRSCGQVKRERLAFLANNAHYTERFAYYIGRRCRSATVQDVAKELHLDWHAVKDLENQYMRAQLARAGTPGPKVLGIDEISIRKRHTYRIVVSDLIRGRPIWFGGEDRSEASMSQFYQWLGAKSHRVRLAVMDMWKPFRNATAQYAHRRRSCSTSSTSCVTLVKRSIRSAKVSTPGSAGASGASSKDRNSPCSRTERT